MPSPLRSLRWIALLGVVLVLVTRLVQSFPLAPRWWIGGLLLTVLTVGVALMALLLMPRAAGTLAKNPDLLVPLGLILLAQESLALIAKLPLLGAAFGASKSLTLFNLSFGLSLHWLMNLLLAVAYATWVTAAILNLVRTGQGDACAVLPGAFRHLLRVAGLMLIGWGGIFVLLMLMGLTMPALHWFAPLIGLVAVIAWNFATAAVLPVALLNEGEFQPAFQAGVLASRANLRRWWKLLLMQMLLLGVLYFTYSQSCFWNSRSSNWNWSVNTFWTGGYHDTCQLYSKLTDTFQTQPVPLITALLGLLFGALAVAVKVELVQRLQPVPVPYDEPPVLVPPPPVPAEPPPSPMPPIPPEAG